MKTKRAEKTKRPPISKKTILRISILSTIAIAGGIGTGILLNKLLVGTKTDYSNINTDGLEGDLDAAIAKYEDAKGKGQPLETALTSYDMANAAYGLYAAKDHTEVVGVGSSKAAMVTQAIQSLMTRDGDRFFEESNSIGLVNLYNRMYQTGNAIETYWGTSPDYPNHPKKEYTAEEYAALMGRPLTKPTNLFISSKTVLRSTNLSGLSPSGITKTSDGYTVELELNPTTAVVNYVKQMKTISDLADYPSFNYIHLQMQLDSELTILKTISTESYYAKTSSGIGSTCAGSLECHYIYNTDLPFPSIGDDLTAEYNK